MTATEIAIGIADLVRLKSDEIADRLRLAGIKARQGAPRACAISEYTKSKLGASLVSTSSGGVDFKVTVFDDKFLNVAHTKHSMEFIKRFDNGEYPDLVDQPWLIGPVPSSGICESIKWPCGHHIHLAELIADQENGFTIDAQTNENYRAELINNGYIIGPDDCDKMVSPTLSPEAQDRINALPDVAGTFVGQVA